MITLAMLGTASHGVGVDKGVTTAQSPQEIGTQDFPEYFVRPSGNDANSGRSAEDAWQTLARVNAHSWQPGDRISFEAGQTFDGKLELRDISGLAGDWPIVLQSFGVGRATLRCDLGSAITLRNTSGVTIKGIGIQGPGRTDRRGEHGIYAVAEDPHGARFRAIRIENVEIWGFFQNGIYVESTHPSDPGFEDLLVAACTIHDNGINGFFSRGVFRGGEAHYPHRNVTIRDCKLYKNTGQPNWPSHSGSGIQLAFVDGALIEYCQAYDNGALNDACGGPVGIWAWEARRVTIQFNESHHNRSRSGCDGGGFGLDGGVTDSVMQFNYSHNNTGAGFGLFQFPAAHPFHNNVVRYNISENEGMGGIHLWAAESHGGIRDTLIHNNTILVGPDQEGGIAEVDIGTSHIARTRVVNNLIVTSPGRPAISVPHPRSWDFAHNAYFDPSGPVTIRWGETTYRGIVAWQAATHLDNGGLETDPELTSVASTGAVGDPRSFAALPAYRLTSSSPLIDAGTDVALPEGIAPHSRDFFGTPLNQGDRRDIGACEFPCPAPQDASEPSEP